MLSMSARLAVASHKPPRRAPKYFAGVVELLIMPQGGQDNQEVYKNIHTICYATCTCRTPGT